MAGLRYEAAFDLCGAEPKALAFRPSNSNRRCEEQERDRRSEKLAKIVEGEIIPRLLVSHRSATDAGDPAITPEIVDKFAAYAMGESPGSLLAIVGGLLSNGVTLHDIYLGLLGPAARRLGEFWGEDRASYSDVTIALGRLQQVVRELSIHGDHAVESARGDRAALFGACPGEQHTFGLVIVEEFFRHAGWRTWTELSGKISDLKDAAAAHHFDLFGMTASCTDRVDHIAAAINAVRQTSRNRDITVIVGGRLFLEDPELVSKVGADGMALDARDALLTAEKAVRHLARD